MASYDQEDVHNYMRALGRDDAAAVEALLDQYPGLLELHDPFYHAIRRHHCAIMQMLLKRPGLSPDRLVCGQPLLFEAIAHDGLVMVRLLMRAGADGTIKLGEHGWTPLMYAVALERSSVHRTQLVEFLLTYDQVRGTINDQEREGFTALHFAAQYSRPAVISMLLKHGPDLFIRAGRGGRPLEWARGPCRDLLRVSDSGCLSATLSGSHGCLWSGRRARGYPASLLARESPKHRGRRQHHPAGEGPAPYTG